MSRNASVDLLRAELARRSARLKANAGDAVEYAAQDLAGSIRGRAKIRSGNTANSVEAVKVADGRWRVQAGGELTTKEVRKGSGVFYDYVRAEEFGTAEAPAHPFFFNTFRARKDAVKRDAIAKITAGVLD